MITLLIGVFVALDLMAGNAKWSVVASFDAGRLHDLSLASGATVYSYTTGDIPVAVLGTDDARRKIVYGNEIGFVRMGALPRAQEQEVNRLSMAAPPINI